MRPAAAAGLAEGLKDPEDITFTLPAPFIHLGGFGVGTFLRKAQVLSSFPQCSWCIQPQTFTSVER